MKYIRFLFPNSQDMQRDIKENAKHIKEIMDDIRRSMKTETESLKCLLDILLSDNIEQFNKIEESIIENFQSQEKTCQDYISYLEDHVKELNGYLSSTKLYNNFIIFSLSDKLKTKATPKTIKPAPPVFTAGVYSKEDVTKFLGKVTAPDTKPMSRKMITMKTASTQNNTRKHLFHIFMLLVVLLLSSTLLDLNIDNYTKETIGKCQREI